ncbi:hypothetical protein DITRI_Ditri01bG0194300 [Diplodiscus trichospermus]
MTRSLLTGLFFLLRESPLMTIQILPLHHMETIGDNCEKFVSELLSAARVRSFQSIREEEVLNLIKQVQENDGLPVNLSENIFSMTYCITARAAFGKKCKDQEAFISVISELSKTHSGFCIGEFFPSVIVLYLVSGLRRIAEKIHQEADRILVNIVNDHNESRERAKGRSEEVEEDLVDVLLWLQKNGEFALTDSNVKAIIMNVFTAGSESSATLAEWTMSEMIKNLRVMREAQAKVRRVFEQKGTVDEAGVHYLKYLKSVIKETLRLHPVFPLLLPRECSKNCEVNGFEIPSKRSQLLLMHGRLEEIRIIGLKLTQKGILFAQPNVELLLAQLLFHFDWNLPNGMKQEDLDMTEEFGLSVRRKK